MRWRMRRASSGISVEPFSGTDTDECWDWKGRCGWHPVRQRELVCAAIKGKQVEVDELLSRPSELVALESEDVLDAVVAPEGV